MSTSVETIEASLEVAYLTALAKKPYNIGKKMNKFMRGESIQSCFWGG